MTERDYVLGTHDEEVERLGLQHAVWRGYAMDGWRRAGFTRGHRILDLGSGPGYATLDLAAIVGREGKVVACDRSHRFLEVLAARRDALDVAQVELHEIDLDDDALPVSGVDGAWARWVFAFVKNPRALAAKVAKTLRPGGVFVIHEYLDYQTWRVVPASAPFERFVQTVMRSWRDTGGEPDIGRSLPMWLQELGFDLDLKPIVDVYRPADFGWQWPKAFIEIGAKRMVDLGYLTPEEADAVREAGRVAEETGGMMVTPAVLQIVATKR